MTPAQGAVVAGRYRLDKLLGEGGMGAVWAATHTVTQKKVAVKFLKSELAANAQLVERFLREARAACAVRHTNVVQIHDVITLDSGAPVMVMDLLEGESLAARLEREGRLPLPELARVIGPVLAAVAAAHAASIVHRDLKPDNLFLAHTPEGLTEVKVLDFGIAKIAPTVDGGDSHLTKTGSMLGTPFYMSPEQLFGERDVDARADVWALGIILYQCLSGVLPTQADNLGQIIKMVTATGFARLDAVAPNIPPDVSHLVERMLSRDRGARPSLDEVRALLATYTGANAGLAASTGADPARVVVSSAPPPRASTPVGRGATPPGSGDLHWATTGAGVSRGVPLWAAIAIAVTAASVLAGGGLFVARRFTRPAGLVAQADAASAKAASGADGALSAAEPSASSMPPGPSPSSAPAVPTEPAHSTEPAVSASAAQARQLAPKPSNTRPAAPSASAMHTLPARPTGSSTPLEEKVPF